jgi:hypothetical protein
LRVRDQPNNDQRFEHEVHEEANTGEDAIAGFGRGPFDAFLLRFRLHRNNKLKIAARSGDVRMSWPHLVKPFRPRTKRGDVIASPANDALTSARFDCMAIEHELPSTDHR